MSKLDSSVLARWRTARRIILGAIVVAGTMSTAAAVAHRVAEHPCQEGRSLVHGVYQDGIYTYSGIGVELTQDGDSYVVSRVIRGAPAYGKLHAGATLLRVDGDRPDNIREWERAIRGAQGTEVELEVVYPCSNTETVVIERDVIQLRY